MVNENLNYDGLIKMEQNLNRYTNELLHKILQSICDSEREYLCGYEIDSYRKIQSISSNELVVLYREGDTYSTTIEYLTQSEKSELISHIYENQKINM